MNIKQAKELDFIRIIEIAGGEMDHSKSRPNQDTYFFKSCLPGRSEATASLNVWRAPNGTWSFKDWGGDDQYAGDIITFARLMSGGTISDGLKWLDSVAGGQHIPSIPPTTPASKPAQPKEAKYYLTRQKHLFQKPFNKNLLAFITSRSISAKIVANYAREVHFTDLEGYRMEAAAQRGIRADKRKKEFFGIGLQNERLDSWEVRTALDKFPKTVIGEKDVSVIDNPGLPKSTVHVFEGMFDFFTWLEMIGNPDAKHPPHRAIVLNSGALAARGADLLNADPRFEQTNQVIFWPQNDVAGIDALHKFAEKLDSNRFSLGTMEYLYEGFKDLNEKWMHTPEAGRLGLCSQFRRSEPVQKFYDSSATADHRRFQDKLRTRTFEP